MNINFDCGELGIWIETLSRNTMACTCQLRFVFFVFVLFAFDDFSYFYLRLVGEKYTWVYKDKHVYVIQMLVGQALMRCKAWVVGNGCDPYSISNVFTP